MTARQLVIPDLQAFADAREFLGALLDANLARNPRLSIRWFAGKLDWPPSYINDVLAGRRQLTLQRALELATFLALDALQSERLILLVLAGSREEAVAAHFKRELAERYCEVRGEEVPTMAPFQDAAATLVFALLAWVGKRLDNAVVREALYTVPDLTDERIDAIVDALLTRGLLRPDGRGGLDADRRRFDLELSDGNPAEKARVAWEMLENLQRYVKSPRRQSPGAFHFKFVSLPASYAALADARLKQVSDWLSELQEREGGKGFSTEKDGRIFQLTYFVAPVVDRGPLSD